MQCMQIAQLKDDQQTRLGNQKETALVKRQLMVTGNEKTSRFYHVKLILISSDNHLKKHAKLNVLFRTYQYGRRTNKDKVVLFFQIRLIGRFLGGEFELKGN